MIKTLYLQIKYSIRFGWRWRSQKQLDEFESFAELNRLLDKISKL